MAHPSDVQPAQQDEPSVEHCGDRRLLQRREVTRPVGGVLYLLISGLQKGLHFNESQKTCRCFTILYLFSFLGYVDKLGVAYEAPTVATGFGAYLAQVSP